MVLIRFIEPDGRKHVVEAEEGRSVMHAAVAHMVPGIEAQCGGGCACGTCHVYVAPSWRELVGPPDVMEGCMLEFVMARRSNSRLACRITVTQGLDGLELDLPDSQGAA